jgi:uncharacterized membrane protein YhaH (DUF805 family)
MLPISILLVLTFCTGSAFSQEAGTEAQEPPKSSVPVFTQALETFKSANLPESRARFSELLTQHPNDPVLLYNLGLVEFTDKHPGKALAYWRKALYLQPGFSPALSGIRQVHRVIPGFKSMDISIARELYWRIPLWFFFGSAFIFFLVAGVLWVMFAARRKKDVSSSSAIPMLASLLFLIFISFALHAYFTYYLVPSGTILETPVAVRSSPSEESPSLLEFNEGDEVSILREQDPWVQVQKSATAVGWIPKAKILVHSGF